MANRAREETDDFCIAVGLVSRFNPLRLKALQRMSSLAMDLGQLCKMFLFFLYAAEDNTHVVRCREFPSVIELVSYVFCFHGVMCGPFCFYKDYIAFIDGSNYSGSVAATGNGVSSCRNGGERSVSSRRRLSLHAASSDEVSVSDGRPGNNSHHRLAAPPAPGVS